MDMFKGTTENAAKAAGKTGNEMIDHAGEDAPTVFEKIMDVVTKFRLRGSIKVDVDLGLERKS